MLSGSRKGARQLTRPGDDKDYPYARNLPLHRGGNSQGQHASHHGNVRSLSGLIQHVRAAFRPPNLRKTIALLFIGLIGLYVFMGKIPRGHYVPGWQLKNNVRWDPIFKDVMELERARPQHNPILPAPEGRNGRYLNFPKRGWGSGWNNILREQILHNYVAHLSRRAFVAAPHHVDAHRPFADKENLQIPSSAFAYAPWSGAPFPGTRGHPSTPSNLAAADLLPRSVSLEYYNEICPESRRVHLNVEKETKKMGLDVNQSSVEELAAAWGKKLREMDDPCVDLAEHPLFDYMVYAQRVMSVWPGLSESPVLKYWDWSPLIYTELEHANFSVPTSSPTALLRATLPSEHPWASKTDISASTIPTFDHKIDGLVVVHVRRGDFEDHCRFLSGAKVSFQHWMSLGWYSRTSPAPPNGTNWPPLDESILNPDFPKLADDFWTPAYRHNWPLTPDGTIADWEKLSVEEWTMARCWQSLSSIRNKLHAVREFQKSKGRDVKDVYLATNGGNEWVGAVRQLLMEDGWVSVKSSKDVATGLSGAGVAVNQAVDMALAHWAEAFIGNGFSSLTANVIGFKLAQGFAPDSIHLF